MDEINIGHRSSDQMGEDKSLCQRRFRSLCWSDGTRSQDVFIISRCCGNRWRSNYIMWKNDQNCIPSRLKTSNPEVELERNPGTDPYQSRERLSEKLLFLKIWTNLEKLVQSCPTSSHRCIPIMTQRKALLKESKKDSGRISRSEIKLHWKIVLRFQSACNHSKFSFHAEPRQTPAHLTHGMHLDYLKTFLVIIFLHLILRDHPQGIHSGAPQRELRSVPQAAGSGTFFARGGKRNGNTIPMPTFAGRPVGTVEFYNAAGTFRRILWLDSKDSKFSELQFDKFPTPSPFSCLKIRFRYQVTTCSDFPSEAMLWIKEVEMVDSMEQLKSSRSVCGQYFPEF